MPIKEEGGNVTGRDPIDDYTWGLGTVDHVIAWALRAGPYMAIVELYKSSLYGARLLSLL